MADQLARCMVCEAVGVPLVIGPGGTLRCEDGEDCMARAKGLPLPSPLPLEHVPEELLRRAARVKDNRGAKVAYQDAAWLVKKALAGPRALPAQLEASRRREEEIGAIVAEIGFKPRINCSVVEAVRLIADELGALRAAVAEDAAVPAAVKGGTHG